MQGGASNPARGGFVSRALPFVAALTLWWCLAVYGDNSRILPSPPQVLAALARMLSSGYAWVDLALTLLRGCAGLAIATVLAGVLGIAYGRRGIMRAFAPLVVFCQGCPPVVWISLLLVWCSVGGAVPIAVVVISVFPALFLNIAGSVAALDERYFELARLYRVPWHIQLQKLVIPGIMPTVTPSLSYSAGIAWKVTATAEFFGASSGVGARVYQSFRLLELPELFAWSLLLALSGVAVNAIVAGLRRRDAVAEVRK